MTHPNRQWLLFAVAFLLLAGNVSAVSIPGDLNGDWRVDAGDYVLARKTGSVSAWRANFGKTAQSAGITVTGSIQTAINANPASTIFYLPNTLYSLSAPLVPKSGDAFVSFVGADLSGNNSTKQAFLGNSSTPNITLYGLTVEKFKSTIDVAAIDSGDGAGWLVDHNEIRNNGAAGVELFNGTVRNSFIHHNGQLGIADTNGIDGGTALVENNEVSFNNTGNFDQDYGAGGIKFSVMNGLTVRNNFVHDNNGQGIWDDIGSINVLYENNTVLNNYGTGILHEIGGTATIRNNVVKNNSHGTASGGQIVLYSSDHTEVYGNTVESNSASNEIIIIQEHRELGHTAHDDYVHDNTITLTGAAAGNDHALSGAADFGYWSNSANLKFDFNAYFVPDPAAVHWEWPQNVTWSQLRALGQEAHGQLFAAGAGAANVTEPSSANLVAFIEVCLLLARGKRGV